MTTETQKAVRAVYERAVQEHLQKSLRTGEDWDRYLGIVQEEKRRLEREDATFAREFDTRMSEARQMILREEHGLRLDQPLPSGVDRQSDTKRLDAKAEERVYRDHDRRKAVIQRDIHDRFTDLTNEIRARDAPAAKPAFDRTDEPVRTGPKRS